MGSSLPALAQTVVGADGAVRLAQPQPQTFVRILESPDVTRAARKVERARSLGAIPKECGGATSRARGASGRHSPPAAAQLMASLSEEVLIVQEDVAAEDEEEIDGR